MTLRSGSVVPPHSLSAEKALLGAVLKDPDVFVNISEIIKVEHFYLDLHRSIYDVVLGLDAEGRSLDIITVAEVVRKRFGEQREQGGGLSVAYLSELVESCPITLNIMHYAVVIRDYYIRRRVIESCRNIIKSSSIYDGGNTRYLERIEKDFLLATTVGVSDSGGLVSLQDGLLDTVTELDRRVRLNSELTGVTSGIRDLDLVTGGWQEGELIILAARPGMGKTALALNWVINALKSGRVVIVFSLEMTRTQLLMRLLSSETRINSSKLRTGRVTELEQDRLLAAINHISGLPLVCGIDDTTEISMSEIRSRCRRFKRDNERLDLVVIDYLQLIGRGLESRYDTREREISEVSRSLKSLAKDLGVPVVSLAQLNRMPDGRVDKRPRMSDLRESGAMEQDADLVIFIYRDEYYFGGSQDAGKAELIIGKNRHGPMDTIKVAFHSDLVTFYNLPHH